MSYKGHKGSIGWTSTTPQHIIDIIEFRNTKYHEDVKLLLKSTSKGSIEEEIDPTYDKIDKAIHKL